ncbi:uncharacterized protein LOC131604194 [Vicia villosa]|uniref:uncharacterized protein LOC131604194 n=1 Tax=Vicia villosa TaxID=3911 RepID=UPI00273B1C8A|nr:uncharacterized protein LOC131604194 [Vicia villosa]
MGEDEKIASYFVKVQNLVHLMKGCGEVITDKMIVQKVMHTLTFHFDHVIVAIQESNNLETIKLKDLVGSLEAHEKDNGATKGKDEGENPARQDSDDYEDMVVVAAVADEHVNSKIWFLDTSYSNHINDRKMWLAYFDESKNNKVKLADNSSLQAEGTDNMCFMYME